MKNNKNVFGAIALLVGTCIGAGIFGLPYVISKVGIIIGVTYIICLGLITLITSLAYGEVVLRTNGTHQFPEYVRIYLGPRFKKVALCSFAIGFYGALTAYLLEVGKFLYQLLNPIFGGQIIYYKIAYFLFVSIALFFGLKTVAKIEKVLMLAVLLITLTLIFFSINSINFDNYFTFDVKYLLLPYGVILFAITGSSAIPDMKSILSNEKNKLRVAIIIGYIIPIIVYIIIAIVVIGICGISTTESAIEGLGSKLGSLALTLGFIFGSITMTTSFLSLALTLKEIYQYDLKINKHISWLIVIIPPLVMILLNLLTFIQIIGLTGAIIGGIDGILMIAMFKKAKQIGEKKPEYEIKLPNYFTYVIYSVYFLGMVYEVYMVIVKLH